MALGRGGHVPVSPGGSGWGGLNAEAVPDAMARLAMARPVARTTCLKLCISGPFGGVVRRACTAALGAFLAWFSARSGPWRRSVCPREPPRHRVAQSRSRAGAVRRLGRYRPPAGRTSRGEVAGTGAVAAWRVRDVVAHVLGTELLLQGESAPPAEVSGLTHVRNPIGEMNEAWVQHLGALTPPIACSPGSGRSPRNGGPNSRRCPPRSGTR